MIEIEINSELVQIQPHMSIGQYQMYIQNQKIYENSPARLLSLYLNVPLNDIKDLPKEQVEFVEQYISSEMIKDFQVDELYNTFEFDGVEYGLENDWSKLAWGAWVDLQVLTTDNIQQNIHTIMAILYRPIISKGKKGKYKIKPYKAAEIEERADIFRDIPIKYWLGASSFFFLVSTIYTNNIKNSLKLTNKVNNLMTKGWMILPKWIKSRLPLDSILLSPTNSVGKI